MAIGKEVGRKLSAKDMGYDKAEILTLVLSNREETHFLCRFVGVVTGCRPYKIKDGERAGEIAYGLMGQFEGTGANGEVKDGTVLYLPGYVNDGIVAVFQSDPEVSAVRIAYDVHAKYDDSSATSYVFTAFDLLNNGSDTVSEVKEAIKALPLPSATPALPAPKK